MGAKLNYGARRRINDPMNRIKKDALARSLVGAANTRTRKKPTNNIISPREVLARLLARPQKQ